SGLCTLLCLTVSVTGEAPMPTQPGEAMTRLPPAEAEKIGVEKVRREGVDVPRGELSLLFGAVPGAREHYPHHAVRFLQVLLAGFVADTAGVLLALIWSAGFLPAFLEPHSAAVLLAKPVPRWSLLVGKYIGVLVFVLFQATVFVGGTWLALG